MSRVEPVERLDAEALCRALAGRQFGHQLEVLEETTSTNDVVFQRAGEHAEGFVVFAERQTAGRGQYGNRWESAASKGLWFSILLRPKVAANDASRITAWAAQSVADTIRMHFSLGATVKLPNDVYVAERKVAGVLLELRAVPNSPHLGVLGIGINVNQTLEDFPAELRERAGSLAMSTGVQLDRHGVAIAVLRDLDRTYLAFTAGAR